jgi:hypothetical protein
LGADPALINLVGMGGQLPYILPIISYQIRLIGVKGIVPTLAGVRLATWLHACAVCKMKAAEMHEGCGMRACAGAVSAAC